MTVCVMGVVGIDDLETPTGTALNILGGSATHAVLAASFLGPARLVTTVGADFPGEHVEFLTQRGVNTAGVQIDPNGSTFHWKGRYGHDLNVAHTLETHLGVVASLSPDVPEAFRDSPVLFLANCEPGAQRQAIAQMRGTKLVAADSMNFWIDGARDSLLETLRLVDLLFLNEQEARMLAGERSLLPAARKLMALGPKTVVIKGGEFGAILFSGEGTFAAPALPKDDVVDPTGAGDSFAGGFLGYLAAAGRYDFEAMKTAVVMGSVLASFIIEGFGCERFRTLTHAEIRTRFNAFRELTRYGDAALSW